MARPIVNHWWNFIGKDIRVRDALRETFARLKLMGPKRKLPPKNMRRRPKKPGPVKYSNLGPPK